MGSEMCIRDRDKAVKTLQNGGKQELQSCTDSGILLVPSEVPSEAVLRDLVVFFFVTSRAALFCTRSNRAIWSAGRPMKTELQ